MLFVPVGSNTFGSAQNGWGVTRPGSSWGITVTPAVGSKGSWVDAFGVNPLAQDTYGLLLVVFGTGASAGSREYCLDVGVDEAGGTSYTTRIANLLCGGSYAMGAASSQSGIWYCFPMFLRSGWTVGLRAQSTVTNTFKVGVQAFQQALNQSQIRCGSFVESYGITPPAGTAITPGTTSEGAWTQIGTTTNRVWWWQYGYQIVSSDTSWNNGAIAIDIAVGDATNKNIVISDTIVTTSSAECASNPPISAGVEFPVAGGTNVYARAQHSGTVDNPTVGIYALGG